MGVDHIIFNGHSDSYLISRFKFSVVITFFLNCVVREMDHPVLVILRRVLSGASPQVAILVPVTLEVAINGVCECVASNVKLAILI